jgi:hypothetical protein
VVPAVGELDGGDEAAAEHQEAPAHLLVASACLEVAQGGSATRTEQDGGSCSAGEQRQRRATLLEGADGGGADCRTR